MRFIRVFTATTALFLILQIVAVVMAVSLRYESFFEAFYAPAFAFARGVTPDAWEFQGNIPLGFAWIAGSDIVYSLIVGSCTAMLCWVANQPPQLTGDARDGQRLAGWEPVSAGFRQLSRFMLGKVR